MAQPARSAARSQAPRPESLAESPGEYVIGTPGAVSSLAGPGMARTEMIAGLRRQMHASRGRRLAQQFIPTGDPVLDSGLPGGGLPTAAVVEWVSSGPGSFAVSMVIRALRPMLMLPGCLAVVDEHHDFNPDALRFLQIPLSRLLLIRPPAASPRVDPARTGVKATGTSSAASLWALEQAVRCPGVRVVLCELRRAGNTVMRRLQLAVEQSGVSVHLIRPHSALRQPSFADLRLLVQDDGFRLISGASATEHRSGAAFGAGSA